MEEVDVFQRYSRDLKLLAVYLAMKSLAHRTPRDTTVSWEGKTHRAIEHGFEVGMSIRALAERLRISKSSLARYLTIFERDGFLERKIGTRTSQSWRRYSGITYVICFRKIIRLDSGQVLTQTLAGRNVGPEVHNTEIQKELGLPEPKDLSTLPVSENRDKSWSAVFNAFQRKYKANSYIGKRLDGLRASGDPKYQTRWQAWRQILQNLFYDGWSFEQIDAALRHVELRGVGSDRRKVEDAMFHLSRSMPEVIAELKQWSTGKYETSAGAPSAPPAQASSGVPRGIREEIELAATVRDIARSIFKPMPQA